MISKRTLRRCSFAAAVLLLASPFALSLVGLLPWSPINCWSYDLDINSGRILYTRYFAFVQVARHVEESGLSRALDLGSNAPAQPDWRRVHTFSPGVRHSPHHAFHSAINQIKEMEMSWNLGEFTPSARQASARTVLQLWQKGETDDPVRPYLVAIREVALRANSASAATDEQDLPPIR